MAKSGLRMAATGYELARSRIYRVAVGDFLKMQLPNNFRQIYWPALSTFPPIGASPPPPPPCHLVCFHSSPSSSKLKTKTFFSPQRYKMIERLQHCDDAPGASKGSPLDKKNYYFQALWTVWTVYYGERAKKLFFLWHPPPVVFAMSQCKRSLL